MSRAVNRKSFPATVIILVSLAVLGSTALAAQDKYTLKIPDGLAWSDFRGYETWQDVAVSQTETSALRPWAAGGHTCPPL